MRYDQYQPQRERLLWSPNENESGEASVLLQEDALAVQDVAIEHLQACSVEACLLLRVVQQHRPPGVRQGFSARSRLGEDELARRNAR